MSNDLPLDEHDVEGPTLNEDLHKLDDLALKQKAAKADFEKADREYKQHRMHCYERMKDEGVDMTKLGGVRFEAPKPTWYGTVQDKKVFQKWAKANRPALVREEAAEAELNKFVRECIEDGRPLPPGVGAYPRPVVRITR